MKKRAPWFGVLLALVIGGLWLLRRPAHEAVSPPAAAVVKEAPVIPAEPPSSPAAEMPSAPPPSTSVPPPTAPRRPDPPPSSVAARKDLADPLAPASFPLPSLPRHADADPDTARDMDRISLMFRDYRTITGENPVGSNAEIMKAMMGENPKGATLGPPEGMALSGEGELLDRWGTPYFFHALSKDVMEIHSAGPDRHRGTDDDLILK
jgi:hypothetical protein